MGPRSRRTTWVVSGVLVCLHVVVELLLGFSRVPPDDGSTVTAAGFVVMTAVYVSVGALLVTRLPAHPVGWLLYGTGVAVTVTSLTYGYAALTLDPVTGSGPGLGVLAAWVTSWSWTVPLLGTPALVGLLFPDGRLPGPRWRAALLMVPVGLGCVLLGSGLAAGGLTNSPRPVAENPFGVLPREVADTVTTIGFATAIVAMVLAGCSLVLRLRAAGPVERQQLKWLMWGSSLLPLYLSGGLLRWAVSGASGGVLAELALVGCLTVVPLAVGTAVLRHRLYDIDLVIHRTLVYGGLTAALAATYLLLVLLFRATLDPLTGGSDLAVALSTLAVAALFRPLRSRIQTLVDRRFDRARYDAARTLSTFGGHLRDQLDLIEVERDLCRVVHPATVSLWLRRAS